MSAEAIVGRDELCSLIPHAGSMCLLDEVIEWSEQGVVCRSETHLSSVNPLRCADGLSILQGIEYGAQAMAVHGGLLARERDSVTPPGYLAALRNIKAQPGVEWLDNVGAPITVEAKQLMAGQGSFIYEFKLSGDGQLLLSGRATVMEQKLPVEKVSAE